MISYGYRYDESTVRPHSIRDRNRRAGRRLGGCAVSPPRVGMIGAGGIAPLHLEAWRALGARLWIHSRSGARDLAARFDAQACADVESLLDAVDIVDIVTPTPTHRRFALAGIAAGKHIVCEKPLTLTSAEAREISDAATAAGVQLYPAHVVRYFPQYAAVQADVAAGALGDLTILRFSRSVPAPAAGSWFYDERCSRGIVGDLMIHDLDQARWLAGEVVEVEAAQHPPTADGVVPSPVTARIVLTHTSGARSHLRGLWGPPGQTFRTSIHVAGEAGSVDRESPAEDAISSDRAGTGDRATYLPPPTHAVSPFYSEMREFAEAFAGGPAPRVTARDGVVAVALVEAALRSVALGRAVPFDEGAAAPHP